METLTQPSEPSVQQGGPQNQPDQIKTEKEVIIPSKELSKKQETIAKILIYFFMAAFIILAIISKKLEAKYGNNNDQNRFDPMYFVGQK